MAQIPLQDKFMRTALSVAGFPLFLYQLAISGIESLKFKPAGRLVDIGSKKLHACVAGAGGPTVILEAGMGGCALGWSYVQHELAKHGTILSYDRAGVGWSKGKAERLTCSGYVDDLKALLDQLGLKPPYLLVGHSYGGMVMRLFASRYPKDVLGIVLVDSTAEHRFIPAQLGERRMRERKKHGKLYRWGYCLAPIAIPRFLGKHIGMRGLHANAQAAIHALGFRSRAYETVYSEFLNAEESANELLAAEPLPSEMPVRVLTAGYQSEEWKLDQRKLLQLTERVKQTVVEDSWHSIQIYQPKAVVDAALELMNG
ncbi:alpha/beta fold hydrolase [Paenibacillus sp. GCM10027627]|uniref:alpha/beta fold hydrolase n=1 Tax=unclassified Paenibacillus TaxID=185978 RepID=UPI003641920A